MALTPTVTVTIADNCKSFTLEDTTGIYAVGSNLGGYGAPNITTDDVTTATFTIEYFESDNPYSISTIYPTLPNTDGTTVSIANTSVGLSSSEMFTDGVYQMTYTLTGYVNITAVSTGSKTFTVSGDRSSVFAIGDTFTITNSTGNNGTYTITNILYSAPNTIFTVSETVPSAVADGRINFTATYSFYNVFFCQGKACLYDKLSDITISNCKDCKDTKAALASKINTFFKAAQHSARCGKPQKATAILAYITRLCGLTNCTSCE